MLMRCANCINRNITQQMSGLLDDSDDDGDRRLSSRKKRMAGDQEALTGRAGEKNKLSQSEKSLKMPL